MKRAHKKTKNFLGSKKTLIFLTAALSVLLITIFGIVVDPVRKMISNGVYQKFQNEAPRSKLRGILAKFRRSPASPSSPQQAAGHSAKANKNESDEGAESELLQEYYSRVSSTIENGLLQVPKESPEQEKSFIAAPKIFLSHKPEIVKAIYLSSWSAADKKRMEEAIEIAKTTEINAVVVDIKESPGLIAYDTGVAEADKYGTEEILISDIKTFLENLHKEEIYVIARITVFRDTALARARPDLAVRQKSEKSSLWLDRAGVAWMDPLAKEVWDYNIALARDALEQGFDEINFDYVRFPSDGNLQNMSFSVWDGTTPKNLIIREFFKHLREKLPKATLSVDFFGLTTVNLDDLGIGQIIEDAFEYFDYVCPMVYPSHYRPGFLEYQNPAQYPYEVIRHSLDNALKRLIGFTSLEKNSLTGLTQASPEGPRPFSEKSGAYGVNEKKAKLRPWLQDFDLLGIAYDEKMVRAEIQAVYDALGNDFCGFMLWNSKNIYTKEVLQPEPKESINE